MDKIVMRFVALAMVLLAGRMVATDYVYLPGIGNDYWENGDWTPAGIPNSVDDRAIFNASANPAYSTNTHPSSPYVIRELRFETSSTWRLHNNERDLILQAPAGNSALFTQNGSGEVTLDIDLQLDSNTVFGGTGSGTVWFNGSINGGGDRTGLRGAGALVKDGAFDLVLQDSGGGNSGSHSGGVTVDGGTLRLNGSRGFNAGYFQNRNDKVYTVNSGATLEAARDWNLRSEDTVILNNGTLLFNGDSYLNTVTLNNGSTVNATGGPRPWRTGNFGPGLVTATGSESVINGQLFFVGNATGPTTTFDVDNALRVNAAIHDHPGFEGGMELVKTGAGTLTLSSNSSSWGGGLQLDGGRVNLTASGALGSGAVTLAAGSILRTAVNFGNDVILAGDATIEATGNYRTVSGQISGAGGVTLASGGGTPGLALSNPANDFGGDVVINGGTYLRLTASEVIPDTANVTVNGNLRLDVPGGGTETIAGLSGTGSVWIPTNNNNTHTLVVGAGGGDSSFAGTIGANGQNNAYLALKKIGTGTLTLNGASPFGGNVTVDEGTVKIGNINALGAHNTSPSKVSVADGATVDFNGQIDAVYGYTIAGDGVGGTGALVNSGGGIANNFRQSSNITLAADASIGGTGNWALLTSGYGATTLDLAGNTLTKRGGNTVTLANATVTAGGIHIAEGTLSQINNNKPGGHDLSAVVVSLADTAGATLNLNNVNLAVGSLAGGGLTGGNVVLGSGGLTVGALGMDTAYDGQISGGGSVTKVGAGTLTLQNNGGANSSGAVTVNGGTLRLNASRGFNDGYFSGQNNKVYTVNTDGTLEVAGAYNLRSNNTVNLVGGTLDVTRGSDENYLNLINMTAGTIKGNGLRLGYFFTPNVTSNAADDPSTISGPLTLVRNGGIGATSNFNVADGNATNDLVISGQIRDLGGWGGQRIIKTGDGRMVLSNAGNTWSGGLSINGGTISVPQLAGGNTPSALGGWLGTSAFFSFDGGTLEYTGGNVGGINRAFVINNGGATISVTEPATTLTWTDAAGAGPITGSGGFTKTGPGSLTFAGNNNYTGGTTISQGTLAVTQGGGFGGGTVTLGDNDSAGADRQVTLGASINNAIVVANEPGESVVHGTAQFNSQNGSITLNGDAVLSIPNQGAGTDWWYAFGGNGVSGPGALTIRGGDGGGNRVVLNGNNSFGGGTVIESGQLQLGNVNAAGTGPITIGSAASGSAVAQLRAGANIGNTVIVSGDSPGSAKRISTYNGLQVLSGDLQINGDVELIGAGDRLTWSGGSWSGSGNVTITGNRVTHDGAANSWTGDMTISGGATFQPGHAQTLGSANSITADGTLQLNNVDQTIDALNGSGVVQNIIGSNDLTIGAGGGSGSFAGVIRNGSGALGIIKAGAGTQVLTGVNTYTGSSTVDGGTLELAGAGSIGNSSGIAVNAPGTFSINRASLTLGQPLSGGGTIANDGSGTTTIGNGGNSFSGRYEVNDGALVFSSGDAFGAGSEAYVAENTSLTVMTGGGLFAPSSELRFSGKGTVNMDGGTLGWTDSVTFAPGESPGAMTVTGDVDWNAANGGGTYEWELFDFSGSLPGTDWDLISIGGELDLTGGTGLIDLMVAPGGVLGLPAIELTVTEGFEIIRADSIAGFDSFTYSFENNLGPWYRSAMLRRVINDDLSESLYLDLTTVPEPGTWALLAGLLLGAVAYRRRRQG